MTTPAHRADLLTVAEAICAGHEPVPGLSRARAACLVTRQALEQVIDGLLAERRLGCPDAGMRVRLLCLAQGYPDVPGLARRAETAWNRLSRACHHHAYELSPTVGEASALTDEVAWLAGHVGNR